MREKMEQVFMEMADMTLKRIKQRKDAKHTLLDGEELEMVRRTESLYETLNHANQSVIPTASMLDVSGE